MPQTCQVSFCHKELGHKGPHDTMADSVARSDSAAAQRVAVRQPRNTNERLLLDALHQVLDDAATTPHLRVNVSELKRQLRQARQLARFVEQLYREADPF